MHCDFKVVTYFVAISQNHEAIKRWKVKERLNVSSQQLNWKTCVANTVINPEIHVHYQEIRCFLSIILQKQTDNEDTNFH